MLFFKLECHDADMFLNLLYYSSNVFLRIAVFLRISVFCLFCSRNFSVWRYDRTSMASVFSADFSEPTYKNRKDLPLTCQNDWDPPLHHCSHIDFSFSTASVKKQQQKNQILQEYRSRDVTLNEIIKHLVPYLSKSFTLSSLFTYRQTIDSLLLKFGRASSCQKEAAWWITYLPIVFCVRNWQKNKKKSIR